MGKINVYDKIVMKKKEKKNRKYGNRRHLYKNLHLKEDFGMEFTGADARGSADTIYCM